MVAQNLLSARVKVNRFLKEDKFQICDCSRWEQMPSTEIAYILAYGNLAQLAQRILGYHLIHLYHAFTVKWCFTSAYNLSSSMTFLSRSQNSFLEDTRNSFSSLYGWYTYTDPYRKPTIWIFQTSNRKKILRASEITANL